MTKRFFWAIGFGFLFVLALSHFLFFQFLTSSEIRQRQENLKDLAQRAARLVDGDELLKIPLSMEGDTSQEYKNIVSLLAEMKKETPLIKYLYVLTNTDTPGVFQFVVDADPLPEVMTAHSPRSFPGDVYDGRKWPALLEAFDGPAADSRIVRDSWGATLSGYAPVLDYYGKTVGVVGVDMDASSLEKSQDVTDALRLFSLVCGFLFASLLLFSWLRKGKP